MDSLNFVPGNFKLHRFSSVDVSLLNQSVTCHHNEQLPLGVVPVLPLGDARTADVNAHLPTVSGMNQFRERTTVVHVHLQGILELVRRQIGQVQGVQFLCKRAVRHLGHHKRTRLRLELLQQIYDLAQRDLVGHGNAAVATVCFQNGFHAVKFTVLLLAFQQDKHPFYKVVDVQQLQLGAAVVDCKRFVIGNCPAEGADGAVVLGAAMSHQVDKTVDRYLRTGLLSILEEQLLASLFAAAILAVAEATSQSCLNGGGQHDGCLIVVLFQAVQQVGCKAKVALHEVFWVFRAIHACQIEHKVCFLAVFVQLLRGGVQIILEDFFNIQCRAGLIFPIPDVFQVVAQGGSHHALSTCDQNVHPFTSLMYCSAVRNICAIRHSCMIADGAVAADAGKIPNSRTGADDAVGVNQGVIPYRCITVDFRSGIQQNAISHRCTILDTSVLQHHTATADFCERTDIGTGRNDVGKRKAKGFCLLIHLCPEPIVADAHHQQTIFFPQLWQISKTTNHRNAANFSAHNLPIVYKGTVIFYHRLFSHHAAKATGSNQQQLFFRHSGCPSVHSGRTRW